MKKGKIVLNLYGTPSMEDSICLSHGHGYYAYVNSNDTFVHTLFRDVCMWGGATDTYYDNATDACYRQYELDCRHKTFFMSDMFQNICHKHDIELIVCDNDKTVMRDFFQSVSKKW